jgi:hypothetical protein
MRRTQIYIDEELDAEMRHVAAAEGRSAAALIRDALRAYLRSQSGKGLGDDPIGKMAGAFRGLPADTAIEHDRDLYGTPRRAKRRPPARRR